jgi:hypothetical protein
MFARYAVVGLVVVACRSSDAPRQQASPAAKVALAAPTPAAPPVEPARAVSNALADRPERISTGSDLDELERETAPYSTQARRSYPDAKRRYLAGLPPGQHLSVVTKLRSPGASEVVFVVVTGINGDQITGRIANNIRSVTGYKLGESYMLSESAILDWVIVRPDGGEEGNLVGKFLDERDARQHQESPAAR